jgi:biopolymer transport protein ExbD
LIAKIRIPANPIPMLNVMVGVMAICMVGASMRRRHY